MKKYLVDLFGKNYFFSGTLIFICCLPFSQALVSISSGLLLFIALVEDSVKNKIDRIKKNKWLFFISAIYFVYLLSAIFTGKINQSFYDLNKTLFFLIIPLSFILGKPLQSKQVLFLFYTFCFSIVI